MNEKANTTLLLVTGLSGAGLSSALKILEDLGYEVFDNFPPGLAGVLLRDENSPTRPIALGIDTRTRDFSPQDLLEIRNRLQAENWDVSILFMDCDPAILQNRFSETRRRHPLAKDRPVADGIAREQALLKPVLAEADLVIDTTDLSIHDLRRIIQGHFTPSSDSPLTITVLSFAFRNGLPREADMVFDVRFLKNPHWVPALKPLTGKDSDVAAYIQNDPAWPTFEENIRNLLIPLLPRYREEGKNYLTIAFGCTGGKHRSVFTVERICTILQDAGIQAKIHHRDLVHGDLVEK